MAKIKLTMSQLVALDAGRRVLDLVQIGNILTGSFSIQDISISWDQAGATIEFPDQDLVQHGDTFELAPTIHP